MVQDVCEEDGGEGDEGGRENGCEGDDGTECGSCSEVELCGVCG